MQKRNQPPIIAMVLLVILVCIFICLRLFPDFSFLSLFPDKEISSENKPDTTAPLISCDLNSKTIKAGDSISVDKLGIRVTDNSNVESILFTKIQSDTFYMPSSGNNEDELTAMKKAYAEGIAISGEEFQFSYGGIYKLTITATDIYANSSDFTFTLKVETPPVIETPSDYYVAIGNEIPYEDYVKVWDLIDGEYEFSNITLDTSNLNIGKEGTYPISFSAKDKYGLTSIQNATVHMLSEADLQELIDSHKINVTDHAIVGAYNKYNVGHFSDATELASAITPALVEIKNEKTNTTKDGFIIKIDEEYITIATNESAVTGSLSTLVTFYDESTYHASVVFTNTEYDLAFIRIPVDGNDERSSVSSEKLGLLRTVHLDEMQWNLHAVTKQVSLKQLLRHYELVFKYKLQAK